MKLLKGKFTVIVEQSKIKKFEEELEKLISKYSFTSNSNTIDVKTSQNINNKCGRIKAGNIYVLNYNNEEQEFIVLKATKNYVVGIIMNDYILYRNIFLKDYPILRLRSVSGKLYDNLEYFEVLCEEKTIDEIQSIELRYEGEIDKCLLCDAIMKYRDKL